MVATALDLARPTVLQKVLLMEAAQGRPTGS